MLKKTLGCFIFGCIIGISAAYTAHTFVNNADAQTQPTADQEAILQAQLNDVLQQIAAQQQALSQEQQKGASIQRDIDILNGQINEAKLKIQAKNLAIAALGKDINAKNQTINNLENKISDSRDSLSQLIRQTNEMDSFTLADVVLSDKDLSAFFLDADSYATLKQSIESALGIIKKNETDTEQARNALTQQQIEETNAKISIQEEQAKIQKDETQKAYLLSLSKQQQKSYQSVIAQQQVKAAQIRAALFALRDTTSIPFGTALQYAEQAQKATGVRPAYLLAVITQESNLGQNVGSCYLADQQTGAGIKVSTGMSVLKVMNPTRDIPPFLDITAAVGRDPMHTRVSCPLSGGGYGGAMGPAQFIPSTWKLFQPRLASALGITSPDPWNPQHAFMASALYLSDLGASGGTAAGERNAACRYYSGRACDNRRPANAFYGDQVMAKATDIQINMINVIENGQ